MLPLAGRQEQVSDQRYSTLCCSSTGVRGAEMRSSEVGQWSGVQQWQTEWLASKPHRGANLLDTQISPRDGRITHGQWRRDGQPAVSLSAPGCPVHRCWRWVTQVVQVTHFNTFTSSALGQWVVTFSSGSSSALIFTLRFSCLGLMWLCAAGSAPGLFPGCTVELQEWRTESNPLKLIYLPASIPTFHCTYHILTGCRI